jgi:hypothetical protein
LHIVATLLHLFSIGRRALPYSLEVCSMERGLLVRAGAEVMLACWWFPGVTCFVVTIFSPCPLVQELKHRILRAPHDLGHLGNLS